jgi:hypothetical protein
MKEPPMPLRDHFKPPVSHMAPWEALHGMWPAVIVQQLHKLLPAGYIAMPTVHLGSRVEIDIATFESDDRPVVGRSSNGGGVATAAWAPAKPSVAVETSLPDTDEYEVRVYDLEIGRRLVAAIEIVSPSNKDRPEHRRLFVGKCADLLRQGVAVSIVDLVTIRSGNLYMDLLEWIGQTDKTLGAEPPSMYAASCRWIERGDRHMLEAWSHKLELGQPLPTLPLWLAEDLVVPLNLEESYQQACKDLRIE